MPALPDLQSTVGYSAAPQPMEDAAPLAKPMQVLAAGMKDVSANFGELSARLQAAQQASDASAIQTRVAMDAVDMRRRYQQDDDPATVPDRFRTEQAQYQQDTLNNIADPGTRFHVARFMAHAVPTLYAEVTSDALGRQKQNQLGALQDTTSQNAQLLANATNSADEQLAMSGLKSGLLGGAVSGLVNDHETGALFSGAVRQAVLIRSATDPARAQSLLTQYAPEMDAGDVAALSNHLREPLMRQTAMGAAQQATQVAGDTAARAVLVHDGMVQRGYDDATAWGMAGNAVDESGASPAPKPGDGGASHGLFQWNKERLAAYQAQYGHLPEQGSLNEQLDFADGELKGSESTAAGLIASAGPSAGDKAAAISRYYLRPADGDATATRRSAITTQLAGSGGQATLPARLDTVRQLTADQPFEVQQHAQALTIEAYHREEAGLQPARADLQRKIGDLMTGYENGVTGPDVPEDQIKSLLPPDQALRSIEQLRIARNAGDLFRAAQWASPEDEQQTRQALAVSGSLAANTPRKDGRVIGNPAAPDSGAAETADGMKLRLAVAAKYDELLTKKHTMLKEDPAAYVASAPGLAERAQAIDPQNPATQQAYDDASRQMQTSLGVARPRILTNAQASGVANQLATVDPATGDMGAALSGLARQYGPHWHDAFGELVSAGKVSPDYQQLASMTPDKPGDADPQAFARQDFQRALMLRAQKGGLAELRNDTPDAARKDIDTGLDGTLDPFREAYRYNAGGPQLVSSMRDSMRTLAYYYGIRGQSASDALKSAYDGLVGARWDIDGNGFLAPKGMTADVKRAATAIQWGLKPEDIAPPPDRGIPGETDTMRRQAMLTGASSGQGVWVPNADASGLTLMARLREGTVTPLRRTDGSAVTLRYADVRPGGNLPGPDATITPPAGTVAP